MRTAWHGVVDVAVILLVVRIVGSRKTIDHPAIFDIGILSLDFGKSDS